MEDRARINEGLRARYSMLDAQYGLGEVTTLEEALLYLDIETGEHLRMNLSALDRIIWEEAVDISERKALFEHLPSNLTPHHRYGMRLSRKYGQGKMAFLAAYTLYFVSGLERESTQWFEGLCDTQGFKGAFDYLRRLYFELRACDAEDTDVLGKIESGIGQGSSYHAVEILGDEVGEALSDEEIQQRAVYESYGKRIRRAGTHQLGAIGKELYAEKRLENCDLTLLWNAYRARKTELQKYWRRA